MWVDKNLKLWVSITIQDESLWSFRKFFRVLHDTVNNISTLNQSFIKSIWENKVLKLFLWELEAKHHNILTSTTPVEIQQMSKIQSRLVVKPKIMQSLSTCQNDATNLLNLSNHL